MSFVDGIKKEAEAETAAVLEAGAEIVTVLARLRELLSASDSLKTRAVDVIAVREAVGLDIPEALRALAVGLSEPDLPAGLTTVARPASQLVAKSVTDAPTESQSAAPTKPTVAKPAQGHEPGVEIPHELKRFPGSKGKGSPETRIAIARDQKRIYDALPNTVIGLSKKLDLPQSRIGGYLNAMQEAGVVMFVGAQREGAPIYLQAPPNTKGIKKLKGALGAMPAGSGSTRRLATAHVVAVEQLLVLHAIEHHGRTVTAPELAELVKDLGIPQARAKSSLDALADQGKYLKRTGKLRSQRGTHNKPGIEFGSTGTVPEGIDVLVEHYKALRATAFEGEHLPPTSAHPQDAAPAATVAEPASTVDPSSNGHVAEPVPAPKPAAPVQFHGLSDRQKRLRDSRNWVCEQHGNDFTPDQLAKAVGIDLEAAQEDLDELRSTRPDMVSMRVLAGSDGPITFYRYEPPTEPGNAAVLDMQRARDKAAQERTGPRARGVPVPHTGLSASDFTRDRALQPIIKKCIEQLGPNAVTRSEGGHIAILTPQAGRVLVSSTPGSQKSVRDSQSRLRRAGVAV